MMITERAPLPCKDGNYEDEMSDMTCTVLLLFCVPADNVERDIVEGQEMHGLHS